MNTKSVSRVMVLSALCLAGLACVGCGSKKIVITNYPSFYTGRLKTIAVVPFRNTSRVRGAGNTISDSLASMLAANGTYRVYNRNDLAVLQNEQDLRTELGLDNSKIAAKFRQVGNVQAVLVGTVTTYASTTRSERKQDPIWNYNKNTGQRYIAGYRRYTVTRNEANVVVSAALIRVSDGTTIASVSSMPGSYYAQGSPPSADPHACLAYATNTVVARLVSAFAVTRQQIKVKSKDFRTASELYDGQWTFKKKFSTSTDKAYVVVTLPASCDRNRFRLTIIRKDERRDLFSQKIVWTKKYGSYGYPFSPRDVAQKGGGPGKYVAKFYSGQTPVMKHEFKIE